MILLESWRDFFVAEVGASAALAGLLFVALSINIQQILQFGHLPIRAAHTLTMLMAALIVSSIALIAAPPHAILTTLAIVTLANWLLSVGFVYRYSRPASDAAADTFVQPMWYLISFGASSQGASLPLAVGALVALGGNDQGWYWIAAGILLSFASAVYNTWVLLVEILR